MRGRAGGWGVGVEQAPSRRPTRTGVWDRRGRRSRLPGGTAASRWLAGGPHPQRQPRGGPTRKSPMRVRARIFAPAALSLFQRLLATCCARPDGTGSGGPWGRPVPRAPAAGPRATVSGARHRALSPGPCEKTGETVGTVRVGGGGGGCLYCPVRPVRAAPTERFNSETSLRVPRPARPRVRCANLCSSRWGGGPVGTCTGGRASRRHRHPPPPPLYQ